MPKYESCPSALSILGCSSAIKVLMEDTYQPENALLRAENALRDFTCTNNGTEATAPTRLWYVRVGAF